MNRRPLLYIFCAALIARIAAIMLLPAETWEYETIAGNIMQGRGFIFPHFGGVIYRSYCEPLYTYLCVAVYSLTNHSIPAMELVQAVFSSSIALVIYGCARRLYRERIALGAAFLIALHPGLIVYTTKLHPLTFDAFFISLALLGMIKLRERFNRRNLIVAALIGGLCVLTRPTILVFLPLALIYILKSRKFAWRKGLAYFAVFFSTAALIFLPWVIRNYRVQGQFMLTRSNGPFVFWLGNNPNFSGSCVDKENRCLFELSPEEFQKRVKSLDEAGQNREFLKAALSWIKAHPFGFIERTIKKFYYFWWFNPQAGRIYPSMWFFLYKAFYLLVLSTGLWGVFLSYRAGMCKDKAALALVVLVLLSISLTQSLFYIETRHRWAVEPIFLIFSAKGLFSFFAWLKHKGGC